MRNRKFNWFGLIRMITNNNNQIDLPAYWLQSSKFCFGHLLERHLEADLLLLVLTKALLHYSITLAILKRMSVGGGVHGWSHV